MKKLDIFHTYMQQNSHSNTQIMRGKNVHFFTSVMLSFFKICDRYSVNFIVDLRDIIKYSYYVNQTDTNYLKQKVGEWFISVSRLIFNNFQIS